MHSDLDNYKPEKQLIPQADKLNTLIKASNVEGVEPIWTTLFAKVRFKGMVERGVDF